MPSLLQFHEDPAVVAWWRARWGRALAWQTPARRRAVLAVGALAVGAVTPALRLGDDGNAGGASPPAVVAAVTLLLFAFLWLVYRAAAGYAALPQAVRHHPQWALHAVYWGLLAVLWLTLHDAGAWREVLLGVAVVMPLLLWRCGYLLMSGQNGRMGGTRFRDHLIYLWPAYGGNETPYGKGLDNLSRFEARDVDALARSQLAGLRLFALAALWALVLYVIEGVAYGSGNALTPHLGDHDWRVPAMHRMVSAGADAPWPLAWASVYLELVKQVLKHASTGHAIVGLLRLFGFNVWRNTYKPLLAESVSEFWNRYYYYFKELLVTFFFLPTFTGVGRRLRRWPAARLFVAVFAAAGLGNFYFHWVRMSAPLTQGRVLESLLELDARMVYCALLAVGIFVSMWREQRRRGQPLAPGAWRRWARRFGVWTFFALLFVWDVRGSGVSVGDRAAFTLGLLGLDALARW
jgi:hypothetical protein